jgi:hypothetical protein
MIVDDVKKARIQHILATIVDGAAWFMAFAIIGFTERADFPGMMVASGIFGAAVSGVLSKLLGRATTKAARALDSRVAPSRDGPIVATYFLPILRNLGEGAVFARAARDVSTATNELELQKRVQRVADARFVVHLVAYAMFAVRFLGFVEASRIITFGLGIGGVFLTAIIGRMMMGPLEREAERREHMQTLGGVSNDEPIAVPASAVVEESRR